MKILFVRPDHVPACWPLIKGWVEDVIEMTGGRRTIVETLDEMLQNNVTLWVAKEDDGSLKGFMTSRIVEYPKLRLLGIELVGGTDIDDWEDEGMKTFIDFAKANGCSGLEGYGRGAAWARKLKRYGWSPVFTTIELMFDKEEQPDG